MPEDIPIDVLVDTAKLRWRIERDYEELKSELGLAHIEGRSWRGFHHHATLCVAAYGFLIRERAAIPPSSPRWRETSRLMEASMSDPRPGISAEELAADMDARMEALAAPDAEDIEFNGMKHADLQIGMEFLTATGRWRVTDIGTRPVIAIKLDQTDPRNYNGSPYSIVEKVFDEYDLEACEPASSRDQVFG